jgi:23S rRNA pseudouridine1911/1915/1917 synthase
MGVSHRWIVDQLPPACVADVLARMCVPDAAVAQGRVFLGTRRVVRVEEVVRVGDTIEVFEERWCGDDEPTLILERDGLIAAYKPAGMATIADHGGATNTLQAFVARSVGPSTRPEAVHATSRLDVGVSGVVVFAIDDRARQWVADAREAGRYRRHYIALTSPSPPTIAGVVDAPIGRGRDPRQRMVHGRSPGASVTAYALAAHAANVALVGVEPTTGRTHQIRVHLAHVGAPILGDTTYGGQARTTIPSGTVVHHKRIYLHAAWVEIAGLSRRTTLHVHAPVPADLTNLWTTIGGANDSWEVALAPLRS